MNKIQLMEILESCLLSYEGVELDHLKEMMTPQNVIIGFKLLRFLESRLSKDSQDSQQNKALSDNERPVSLFSPIIIDTSRSVF
jgi:hypothetical protein